MDEQFKRIQELCAPLEVSVDQLLLLKQHMLIDIENDLKSNDETETPIKSCWPTFVQDFPSGCEHGTFLVLGLEDVSFRISLHSFRGEYGHSIETEIHEIPEVLFASEDVELFDHMSLCLQMFLKKSNKQREPLSLAFNFCYPLKHESLTAATITPNMGRFNFTRLMETSLSKAFSEAITRKNPRVELVALLNNATGVLLSCCRHNPQCKIGAVVGLGTNIAYVEKTEVIEQYSNGFNSKPSMVVHYDWGAFGAQGTLDHIRTDLDRQIDANTKNSGHRLFDKLISIVYVAEMARRIFVICAEEGILFGGDIGRILKTPYSFTSRDLVEVLSEEPGTFYNTRLMFDRLGVTKPSDYECSKVRYILESTTKRSAALVAAGIASLVDKIGDQSIDVGIDGSFYHQNTVYHYSVLETLRHLLGDECRCELIYAEDGCGKGSAILAALTLRQNFIYQGSNVCDDL